MSKTALVDADRRWVFKLPLKNGADPDVAGSDGRTAREIARRKKDTRYSAALS